ncbi:MAG: ABC transporter substrate-binding protein [Deltaproteobacteria bacterium]|jgi:branched-chain amino acid transport system substrate-binding protein|nr:ABC transporter substrate-binding protein [Deltaproteobacteria bacterium]
MRKASRFKVGILAGVFILVTALTGTALAEKPVVIGLHIDYDRLTTLGPPVGQGMKDFIKVFKSKGGTIDGIPIEFSECNHGYDVNRGLECYQRQKMEGIVSLSTFGTPHTYSLTPKLTADKIPAISPGFGRGDAMDGTRFPYIFPAAASYWSQATASVQYIQDAEKGAIKGKKIAYLYFDNPAGKEPIPILEKLRDKFGFELRTFGVPSPGVEMGAQVTDITRRYRADWVIAHLFGRAPSVSFKELYRKGFPMDHYIGFVWGVCETDVMAAGKDISKGMVGLQFNGLGQDFPIHKEIQALYKAEGTPMHEHWDVTGYYNRGIFFVALQLEAVRNAIKLYGPPITGEKVKKGYEHIKDFTLDGFLPPMEITPEDHEGGGWVRAYQWDGEKFVLAKDWYKAHRDVIKARLDEVAKEQ